MTTLIFLLIALAMLFTIAFKQRKTAITLFFIALVISCFWFGHHATDALNIQL